MGNWKIEIEGCGAHHNGRYDDAERIAGRGVAALKLAGHAVQAARLVITDFTGAAAAGCEPTDLTAGHPDLGSGDHIEQFFAYDHLPPHLKSVSAPFAEMANFILATLPRNPERTVALRKLLEAKDAAVRAKIAKEPPSAGTKESTK